MTDQLETEYREKLFKEAAMILAQEIHTLEPMVKELRTHVISTKWTPLLQTVQIVLLCCILVALIQR